MGLPVAWHRLGVDAAGVALVAPAVGGGIAVQHLAPMPAERHAHAIMRAHHRREIQDHHQMLVARRRLAQEGQHAALAVVAIDPLEPRVIVIPAPQAG